MRRFQVFRRGDLSATHNSDQVNAATDVQFSGVVFEDGTCVIRWHTAKRSTSVWATFEDAMGVHGHFDGPHGTELRWLDDDDTPLLGFADGLERAAVLAEQNLQRTASGFVALLVDELKTAAMEARQ